MTINAALIHDYPEGDGAVFGKSQVKRIAALTNLYPEVVNGRNFAEHASALADVQVIFATWGMPTFGERHFAALPDLKAVFYAAGNVKSFAAPLLERGVILVSAWDVNAIPVAEMCLAQILLSLRGYFRAVRNYHEVRNGGAKVFPRRGVHGETVGLVGLGKIGARLRRQLANYPLHVIAHDPLVTLARAKELDVELVSMEQLFERSLVVSNHIPDLDTTRGVLSAPLFERMRDGATFINTGRGAQVVEDDLIRVFAERRDLTALLDITNPEPPDPGSPLWKMGNVIISPHIGGTIGDEVTRLADCAIEEFERWAAGDQLRHRVTWEVFATMG
jgi:phosphoglycerate dehydrogenase-like enzyme